MATVSLTDEEIRSRGLDALARELGPAGLLRFLKQFERGHGDYSKERHKWLGEDSVRGLVGQLRRKRRPAR